MGKCIGMMSKNRFRILSGIVTLLMIYLYSIEPTNYKERVKVDKTWNSLVQNCGYVAYEENSLRANHFYAQYADSGNWTIEGIYIGDSDLLKAKQYKKLSIKMDPTQFADPTTPDFLALIKSSAIQLPNLSINDRIRL